MKAGTSLNCAGVFKPGATLEDNLGLLAQTDALRRRHIQAVGASVDRSAPRAVPLKTILPFAILGGNALMHHYLSRRHIAESFLRNYRADNDENGTRANASFPAGEG